MLKRNVFGYSRAQPVSGLTGKVFAIRFMVDRWGFIRFRNGSGFGFLAVYSVLAGMPRVQWNDTTEKWFASELSGAEKYESDDYVIVGQRPAATLWMPDRFQRPQFPWQRWTVLHADKIVHVAGPEDVVGLEEAVWLDPAQIVGFLRRKYDSGELSEVVVDPPEPCPVDPDVEQRELQVPTVIFARIVQPTGPAERERIYEEPLAEFLQQHALGEITGGGTMQDKDGSVLFAGLT